MQIAVNWWSKSRDKEKTSLRPLSTSNFMYRTMYEAFRKDNGSFVQTRKS